MRTCRMVKVPPSEVAAVVFYGALLAIFGPGCGQNTPQPTGAEHVATPAMAPWALQTTSIGNGCESRVPRDEPVRDARLTPPLSAHQAVASRDLEAGTLITTCQNLASVAAVCDCLTAPSATSKPSEYATCDNEQPGGAHGQVISVASVVEDDAGLDLGHMLVLVAKIGSNWSALSVLDAASDIDRHETPNMTQYVIVVDYQERVTESGIVLWAQTINEQNETSMGVWEVSGDSELTICTVPHSPSTAPACKASVPIANWMFAFEVGDELNDAERCTVEEENSLAATLESSGNLTVTSIAGVDEAQLAGVYRAWN